MNSPSERLDACDESYLLHFAGQARLTRNLDMLDFLLDEAESVAAMAAPPDTVNRALQQARRYRDERQAIAAAQEAAGPQGRTAAFLTQRADFIMHRYTRHFAGQPRLGRDVSLLAEIHADLSALLDGLRALAGLDQGDQVRDALATVTAQAGMVQDELGALHAFLAEGPPAHRAAAWGALVNALFATYQAQFFGYPQPSCRPELMTRLVQTLEHANATFTGLYAPTAAPSHHLENMQALGQELGAWRDELSRLQAARLGLAPRDLADALNEATEAVLEAYNAQLAGVDHAHLDLSRVRDLCDRLDELERQMTGLEGVPGLGQHPHNLAMARDALTMLCALYDVAARSRLPTP